MRINLPLQTLLTLVIVIASPTAVFCQADEFTLPAGIEQTVIPKRWHSSGSHGPSTVDIQKIETFRSAIEKYYQAHNYVDAEPIYQSYVGLLEKVAPTDPFLAAALQNYADLLRKLGRGTEATAAEARAQAILTGAENRSVAYALKNYQVGMSLDDFSKLAPPTVEPGIKPICSCDAGQTAEVLSEQDKSAKVIQCGFWKQTAAEAVAQPYAMTVAGIQCTPDFRFIEEGGAYRLFEISVSFFSSNFTAMKSALIAKYGEPRSQKVEQQRTKMGNIFPFTDLVWDNGISKIRLTNADGKSFERARLRYMHRMLFLAYSKRINELNERAGKHAADDL